MIPSLYLVARGFPAWGLAMLSQKVARPTPTLMGHRYTEESGVTPT
ncbi:MAG: hypothetical protein Q7T80_01915 [Methanoregula sp.]|nr:hypothetical protein [Methanoregula sp.]